MTEDVSMEPERGSEDAAVGSDPRDDEVTLGDLLAVLLRRRRLVAAVFAGTLLITLIVTAATDARYEATATLLPFNEAESIVAILNSETFAANVALIHDGARSADVRAALGTGWLGDLDRSIITIHAGAGDAQDAADVARAYVETLSTQRELLEQVTWGKNWQAYYEAAGKNETLAREQLGALVAGMAYYEELDPPVPPTDAVAPNWRLNLTLGVVMATMLALFAPFVVEAGGHALREAARRNGEKRSGERPPGRTASDESGPATKI